MSNRGKDSMGNIRRVVLLSLTAMFSLFSSATYAQTTVSTTALSFGNVAVGSKSAIGKVAFKNSQTTALNISSLALTGTGYALDLSTTTCANPGTLAAGATCAIAITLTPAATGAQPGSLTISDNAGNTPSTATVTLSGTGVAPTVLSMTSLNFGNVAVGSKSAILTTLLRNSQTVALNISPLVLSGTGYALDPSTTCANPGTLAAGATCAIAITLTPAVTGPQPGSLTISDNAGNMPSTATVTLSGTGVPPPGGVVSGNINLNSCGGGSLPQTTVTISTSPVLTATTDGNGHFSFPSVPNGTYTVTPSITGPSSVFYPATQTVVVNNGNITTGFSAALGYTVSGTVSYGENKTGQVYLALNNNSCGGNSTPGTSITEATLSTGGGAFTIRGVAPGTYTLQAWMDNLSYGAQNASNPTGSTASVQVSSANLSGVAVTLTDPGATTLGTAPTLKMVSAIDQGAIVQFNAATNGNGVEAATSYTLEWGTDSTFATFTGSKTFAATGTNGSNLWIVSGLTNGGQPLYFRAQGVAGSSTSNWSTASSGVTIGASTGGNTVSGAVTFTGTASGPLYVGFYDQNTNNVYATPIANPVSPQQYTVQVPTGSNYFFFGIIDQNNNGLISPDDITNTSGNGGPPSVTISPTSLTQNLTLPSAASTVQVTTQLAQYPIGNGQTGTNYYIDLTVNPGIKQPIDVTLTSGPNLINPVDMGVCGSSCGHQDFQYSANIGSAVPSVGDTYTFTVIYSDGTTDSTVSGAVSGVLTSSALATLISPTGNGISAA